MPTRSPRVLALGAAALLGLAACSSAPAHPGSTPTAVGGSESQVGSGTETEQPAAGADGSGPVSGDGMPDLPLEGCGEVVESSKNETDADWQWRFEFACDSRDAYDASVAALDALGTLSHPQNQQLGNETYLSDINHFIGQADGRTLDVNLKLIGPPDDVEVVYLVTLRKND